MRPAQVTDVTAGLINTRCGLALGHLASRASHPSIPNRILLCDSERVAGACQLIARDILAAMEDAKVRPWIATAVFCERVLEEKDDVLSVVRIIQKITVTAIAAPTGKEHDSSTLSGVPLPLTAFVSFRAAGRPSGPHELKLIAHSPTGKVHDLRAYPDSVTLVSGDQVLNLVTNFRMQPLAGSGVYWFDVLLDGELVTRMPLQIEFVWKTPESQPSSQHLSRGHDAE